MTAIAISGDPMTEVLSPGTYTRREFDADRAAVRQGLQAREKVVQRVQVWESTNSIDMARRLVRMRTEGEDYWRTAGSKGNDREFYDWAIAEYEDLASVGWAKAQLMAGRALPALEKVPMGTFPVGASQIRDLGSRWYLASHRERLAGRRRGSQRAAPQGTRRREGPPLQGRPAIRRGRQRRR